MTRQFATSKFDKPANDKGETITFVAPLKTTKPIIKRNPRRWLVPVLVICLILQWLSVMIFNLVEVICGSIKELTLSLESFINNANSEPSISESNKT